VILLELLAVIDDAAGHGGAEVGEGGEIGGGGGVGVELILEVGGARGFVPLKVVDSGGGELVAEEEAGEDEKN